MPPYDSDSSAGEDGDYTETSTLLGYSSKEPTDDTISQLGGYPTWLSDKSTASGSLAKCKVCNGFLTLLLQLNGDLPERFPGHERRLYLLHCRRKACRRKDGSTRGIRANKVTKSKPSHASSPSPVVEENSPLFDIGATLFGGSHQGTSAPINPFSTKPGSSGSSLFTSSASANPFAGVSSLAAKPAQRPDTTSTLSDTFASKARISEVSTPTDTSIKATRIAPEPHEPWPPESSFPSPYPKTYLDAEYETLSAPSTPQVPQVNLDMDADMGGTSSGGVEQLFESTMDKTFQKFADRLAHDPKQILRYEFGGQPLLYSTTDEVGKLLGPTSGSSTKIMTAASSSGDKLPRCTNCGANRVFELQLTPYAITVLEEEEVGLDGMDWGTVILAVCEKDCSQSSKDVGEVGYLEEWVGVQWEEREERKKR